MFQNSVAVCQLIRSSHCSKVLSHDGQTNFQRIQPAGHNSGQFQTLQKCQILLSMNKVTMPEGYDIEQCLTDRVEHRVDSYIRIHTLQAILTGDVWMYPGRHFSYWSLQNADVYVSCPTKQAAHVHNGWLPNNGWHTGRYHFMPQVVQESFSQSLPEATHIEQQELYVMCSMGWQDDLLEHCDQVMIQMLCPFPV